MLQNGLEFRDAGLFQTGVKLGGGVRAEFAGAFERGVQNRRSFAWAKLVAFVEQEVDLHGPRA